jgi:S1-C subfamily serine protease
VSRRPLYSRSGGPRRSGGQGIAPLSGATSIYAIPPEIRGPGLRQRLGAWWRRVYDKHQAPMLIAASAVVAAAIVGAYHFTRPPIPRLSDGEFIADVNTVVDARHRGPSLTSIAYAKVIPSVVLVQGYDPKQTPNEWMNRLKGGSWLVPREKYLSTGTGVVIDDKGDILTNFHVAGSEPSLRITYMDGTVSEGKIVGAQPDNDLAVIRTTTIPDDLVPATTAASTTLNPGDEVVAIGFPFGIGPSVSSGVVSGLHRAFEGDSKKRLTDLIQFDAAANPGNSGGPLANADGEVVGIVTAILNPSGSRTFAGIGFAMPIETAASTVGDNPL